MCRVLLSIHYEVAQGFAKERFRVVARLILGKVDGIIHMCICNHRSQPVDAVVQRVHFVYNVHLRDDVGFVTKDPI